ncbi:restriction endonuclease [Candidatus Bathyarchaeota archaeon]|nr:restriction endonuclease [Candidatus Bathyarchaeota archaeon]
MEGMNRQPLMKLAIQYFTRRGYTIDKNPNRSDMPSTKRCDLIVRRGSEVYPVWIKDWNRTIGVNVVINIDKVAQSAGFTSPILIAEKFSEHAKAYASRRGIRLLARTDILKGIKAF